MKLYIATIFVLTLTLSTSAQKLCLDAELPFLLTEVMPEPSPSLSSVEQMLNQQFNASDCGLVDGDKILIQFKVNCEGEDFDYQAVKFNKEAIDCGLGEFLQSTLTWTKAKQRSVEVDFSGTLVFEIQNSTFVLLSSSTNQLKKGNKRKK